MHMRDRVLLLVIVGGFVTGGGRLYWQWRTANTRVPIRRQATEGRAFTAWSWSAGEAHEALRIPARTRVVYILSTRCEYCEAQRTHVGQLLSSLPREVVMTIAPERAAALRIPRESESGVSAYAARCHPSLRL